MIAWARAESSFVILTKKRAKARNRESGRMQPVAFYRPVEATSIVQRQAGLCRYKELRAFYGAKFAAHEMISHWQAVNPDGMAV